MRRDVNISTITPARLARFLTLTIFTHTALGKRKATVSINRSKSALRSFFRFLTDSGYLKKNPARLVKSAPCTQKPPAVLAQRDIVRLLTTIRKHNTPLAKRDHLMFSLLLGTGIRLGSLVGLNVGDLDPTAGTIRINGKRNVEQHVFLNAGLRRKLQSHLAEPRNAEVPLFLSSRGNRIGPRQVELRLAHWVREAGLVRRCTVHSLRHTFATRLYENTGNLRLVQQALGHRRITTTEIYAHAGNATIKRAVQRL